ncbi:glycerophosphocholine cholinephosphodiesterase ENPP6 [Ixodes scapularis]|nr:glycerophosphocholine cholinephosphodiesterase ENPP6 [Ixodes scapularis]
MRRSTSMSALHAFLLALAASLGGLCGAKTLATGGTPPRVILILVDGVRWDYLDEPQLPGFTALARDGVKAKYVVPIMPANSYPNWYSIVTGLYGESHGFVQNYMYDEKYDDYFEMAPNPNASHAHWWNHAEPIWVTAEKNGLRTAMYWWDGCQVEIFGTKPTFCLPYKGYWGWDNVTKDTQEALSKVLSEFEADKLNFALVYFEAVDARGHQAGPDSPERRQALQDADAVVKHLLDDINRRKMHDQVSVVVVSDHGMADTADKKVTVIDIEPLLDYNDIQVMLDGGSFSMLRPYPDKIEKVYNDLTNANIKGLHVYKREGLPDLFHLKHTYLTQPLVLTADPGYYIKKLNNTEKMKPMSSKIYKGNHGYDPLQTEDMRAIFLATGPGLKKGFLNEGVHMVDHYNVVCRLLGIAPKDNNGTLAHVEPMFSGAPVPTPAAAFLVPNIILAMHGFLHH